LAEHFPAQANPADVDLQELQERMLVIEAVESARCLEEGVLITVADANIGSIMGIGFPPWTGGVLQYIAGYLDPRGNAGHGVAGFVTRADELAEKFGHRFMPNALLRKEVDTPEVLVPDYLIDA
jgi:3-hydroxyacyl-CoA dehydrogenase/enoyl-CoA hydratase/3-hydroxybutyryl-CoA epimerase